MAGNIKDLIVKLLVDDKDMAKIGKAGDKTAATFSAIGNTLNGAGQNMTKYVTAPALAAGTAVAAMTIPAGMDRLVSLDNARAKLSGLGHDAGTVQTIMDNALASVKGTAFGMGDAATVAASAVAAGIQPGEDLTRNLKLVADAATIAGVDMGSMGGIFNKVAASNKVQMDVINQLHDAGVPALQFLASKMGVTAEEATKMASSGKIDFATFQAAMEEGLGGAALASGDTFEGAMANMRAAMGRTGASFMEGAFPLMRDGFVRMGEAFEKLTPLAVTMGEQLAPVLSSVIDGVIGMVEWFGALPAPLQSGILGFIGVAAAVGPVLILAGKLSMGIGAIIPMVRGVAGAFTVLNGAMKANPILAVVSVVATLVAALVTWLMTTEDGQRAWGEFTRFIGEAWTNTVKFITDGFEAVTGFFGELWTNIGAGMSGFFGWIGDTITAWNPLGFFADAWNGVTNFFGDFWNGLVGGAVNAGLWLGSEINKIVGFFTSIPDRIGDAWNGLIGLIRDVMRNVMSFTIDVWNNTLGSLNFNLPWFLGGGNISFPKLHIPALAEGGIVTGPTLALIGEAGPEAVVPLSRGSQYGVGAGQMIEITNVTQLDGRELSRSVRRVNAQQAW